MHFYFHFSFSSPRALLLNEAHYVFFRMSLPEVQFVQALTVGWTIDNIGYLNIVEAETMWSQCGIIMGCEVSTPKKGLPSLSPT